MFLRTRVLIGRLTLQEEQELTELTRAMLTEQAAEHPAYRHYLDFWDQRVARKMETMAAIGP